MNTGASVACPDCGAMLPATGLTPGVTVQCAQCGKQFALESQSMLEPTTSSKAIASLALGIIPVPFITGIPAVILGIWALIDIRRRGGLLTGRGLAICGMIFGSIWMLACTLVVPVAIIGIRGTKVTENADEIAAIAGKIADFDLPVGLNAIFGMETPFIAVRLAVYGDRQRQPGTMIMFMKFPAQMAANQQQMDQQMQMQMRNQQMGLNVEETKQLTYTIRGQPAQVTESIGTDPNTGQRGRQYVAMLADPNGPLMVMLITTEAPADGTHAPDPEDTAVRLTEEEVREFFESIK